MMVGHEKHSGLLLCVLPFPEPKEIVDRIRAKYPNLKVKYIYPQTQHIFDHEQGVSDNLWTEATFLATLSALPSTPDKVPNLEFIQIWSAGTNHVQSHPIYVDSSISLATVSGIHGPNIAEWILMTVLVSSHSYNMLHEWQQAQCWGKGNAIHPRLSATRDAVGMRLAVLGYGSIGRQAARVCSSMGMDVIAFTANSRETPESRKDRGFIVPGTGDPDGTIPSKWYSGLKKEDLHEFLGQDIDILLISVPLTKETKGLIGKEELEILSKKNAFISNISRGKIIVQDELIAQLKAFEEDQDGLVGKGKKGLRGAALDVADPEPLPDGHPLFTTPNCIITPHISALGTAYLERAFQVLELNLERWSKNEQLINQVDRQRGY